MEKINSYNQIAKSTGIFGGLQIINILISIIKLKFAAVFLGTAGLGIIGLFTTTIGIISALTNFGLSFSAVRNISIASTNNDESLLNRTIITIRRWINFSGIIGATLTLLLASRLSHWIFNNNNYTWTFVWLSISLFFQALSSGKLALLQGLHKLKQLAKANVLASILSLCFTMPLYYYYKIEGIVPSIILSAFFGFLISWYFTKDVKVKKIKITFKESFSDGIDMVKLGSVVMITNFTLMGVMYLIQLFISHTAGVDQVGLYTASVTILTVYIGLVFSSMLPDFLPRLSAISNDNIQINRMVNQQTEMAVLILGPILILLLSSLPIVISILFTSKFMPMILLVQWAVLGVLFRAANWTIGIMIIAKGDFKLFLVIELSIDVIILITNIVFYHFFKLEGIGIAYLLTNAFTFLLQFTIVRKKYSFYFGPPFIKIFIIQFLLTTAAFIVVWQAGFPIAYYFGAILLILSILFSVMELKKRINLRALIINAL
jgi:O-antigen/teichoic acid export membrane protein